MASDMSRKDVAFLGLCLGGVGVSLVLVGVVSGTVPRHVFQIVPVLLIAGLLLTRSAPVAWVAVGVLGSWVGMIAFVWLHMLGLLDVASGNYSLAEIVLTIVVAGCSLLGIHRVVRAGTSASARSRAGLLAIGVAVQFGYLAISFRLFE